MGYLARRRQFNLIFEDKPGLEVRASSTSLGEMMGLTDLASMGGKFSEEDKERLDRLFGLFISCVREWNLEHEGPNGEAVPTPITFDGLMLHDADFAMELVFAWQDGVLGTPGPLGQRSAGGVPSAEVSIPMETLLESQPLSSIPS
jgi:hypothetical protein